MSLDGRFLKRLARELDERLSSGRIQRIQPLAKAEFLFLIRAKGENLKLLISASAGLNRIHLTNRDADYSTNVSGFCSFLRKYLEGGQIETVEAKNNDRIVALRIRNTDEIGKIASYDFYVELMGKYANLVVVDDNGIILESFLHISPFEGRERALLKGLAYTLPEEHKIPFDDVERVVQWLESTDDLTPKAMLQQICGTSPQFAAAFFERFATQPLPIGAFYRALEEAPTVPTMTYGEKTRFYYFDLFEGVTKKTYATLSELLDEYYDEQSRRERMKQIGSNVTLLVKRELEKAKNKLEKLMQEREAALHCDPLRIEGDLIKEHQSELIKGMREFQAYSHELQKTVNVRLDPLLSPIENMTAVYKRYRKQKHAIGPIESHIERTKDDIAYFEELTVQIEQADQNDLREIVDELSGLHYLKAKPTKKKNVKVQIETYLDESGNRYLVGKNNLQNDALTHRIASPGDHWFHVQKLPGSHVVVQTLSPLDEAIIRHAANLAAVYSKGRYNSSLPVDYTLVKHVKKVPGKKGSFVTYTNQKTIYVDPDPALISRLKKK
jgi:predicted ribosome quality control (RQC) complex YloA/Tae2 family protein